MDCSVLSDRYTNRNFGEQTCAQTKLFCNPKQKRNSRFCCMTPFFYLLIFQCLRYYLQLLGKERTKMFRIHELCCYAAVISLITQSVTCGVTIETKTPGDGRLLISSLSSTRQCSPPAAKVFQILLLQANTFRSTVRPSKFTTQVNQSAYMYSLTRCPDRYHFFGISTFS